MYPGISSLVKPFTINEFMEKFQQPFTSYIAFRNGAIDEKGRLTKNGNIDPFEFLVLKIKVWLEQLCPGVTKNLLGSYAGMYSLMNESANVMHVDFTQKINVEQLMLVLEHFTTNNADKSICDLLVEEMSSGGAGLAGPVSATVAGGVSGYDAPMGSVQRRKGPSLTGLAYSVEDENEYNEFVKSKYVKRLKQRNAGKKIAVTIKNTSKLKFI